MADSTINLNILVDTESIFNGVKQVIETVRPKWNQDEVNYKVGRQQLMSALILD